MCNDATWNFCVGYVGPNVIYCRVFTVYYRVVQFIAEVIRVFTNGEFIKKCMMAVGETICPEKKIFFNVSLSVRSITWWLEKIVQEPEIQKD